MGFRCVLSGLIFLKKPRAKLDSSQYEVDAWMISKRPWFILVFIIPHSNGFILISLHQSNL